MKTINCDRCGKKINDLVEVTAHRSDPRRPQERGDDWKFDLCWECFLEIDDSIRKELADREEMNFSVICSF